jgi:undecaprenyl-diphosphatase
VAFGVATAVHASHPRLGKALYALAFLWGVSRVYAGVHYPTDIVGGACIGVAAALAARFLLRRLEIVPRLVLRTFRLLYVA